MGTPSALEVCRTELFTKVEDLQQKYPQTLVDKVVRVREMYNWFLSNPGGTDREFVSEVMQRHSVSKVKLHSQEMMLAQVGSPLAIENAHRNLLDMEDDE